MVVWSKGLRLQNEDSTMAKPVSTQKRRKKKLWTELARTVKGERETDREEEEKKERRRRRSSCFTAPPLLRHRLLPFLFFFFFLVQIQWKVGNREKWSDHGSQNREIRPQFAQVPAFSHRTVLEAKITAKINSSRFFQSDCTVRFGFQNLGQNQDPT